MIRHARVMLAAIGAALLSASCGQSVMSTPYPEIDPQQIRAHLDQFTAAEDAGVAPGSRGEQIAVAYSKKVFTEIGLPVQTPNVPLTKIRTTRAAVTLSGAGGTRSLEEGTDIIAWSRRHETVTSADGDLVFVGYGISTPRQGWDDYKGVDVRGKILLMLIGDPHVGQRRLHGAIGGDLFGRSRYKFEEAERRGAAGVLLVHLDDESDEPWSELQEVAPEVLDAGSPGQFTTHMPLEGWISTEASRKLFSDASLDFDDALARAEESNFAAVTLPVRALVHVESEISAIASTNVIATIPPVGKPQEYVIFSTQWNNLPVGHATGNDLTDADPSNQSPPGVSVMLEIARALSRVRTPHRGFVFLVMTAEPQGLLGLDSYLENPAYATVVTRAAIHVAGFNARGDDNRVAVVGVAYEAIKSMVREQAAEQFRIADNDLDLERLHFFRPARTAYTLRRIPNIFLSSGRTLDAKDAASKPLDMSIGVLDARLMYTVGLQIATNDQWPNWTPSRTLLDYVPNAAQFEGKRPRGIR